MNTTQTQAEIELLTTIESEIRECGSRTLEEFDALTGIAVRKAELEASL